MEGGVKHGRGGAGGGRGCQRWVHGEADREQIRGGTAPMLLTCSYRGITRGVGGGEHSHGADDEEDEFGHDAVAGERRRTGGS